MIKKVEEKIITLRRYKIPLKMNYVKCKYTSKMSASLASNRNDSVLLKTEFFTSGICIPDVKLHQYTSSGKLFKSLTSDDFILTKYRIKEKNILENILRFKN